MRPGEMVSYGLTSVRSEPVSTLAPEAAAAPRYGL